MRPDGPTLVIRKAPWRFWVSMGLGAFGLLINVGLLLLLSALAPDEDLLRSLLADPVSAILWSGTLLYPFALMGIALHQRLWGEGISLSPEGLKLRTLNRNRTVRWKDVKQFRVERPLDSPHEIVGWDHHDDAGDGNPRWEGNRWEGKRTSTLDAHLETGWAISPHDLCGILEEWRLRYAG